MSTNPNLLPTSKMTRSVIDAFKGLNVGSAQDVSDHEAIYEVSYQYLSKVKQFKDLEAFHNCLVSLINTDKYYKALTLINEVPTEIHQEYPLEKAYVYYKTGNTDLLKALYDTTVASSGLSEVLLRAMKHVMAQSCYQNGEVTHALKLYHELISSNAIDSQIDLACNERAILSQVLFKTSSSQKPLLNLANADDSYDFIFNNALIELAKGNLAGSLDLLNSALDLCKTQNMDSDPADLALELTPINLTIAYIYQVTGREQKAIDVLENLDLADTADLMLQLIVKNNLISVQPVVDNVNYSSRELNYHHNLHHLRLKLTKSQSKVLLKNHLLLSYQTNTLSKSSTYVSNRFIKQFITDSEGDYSPLVYKVLLKLDVTFEDIENPETNRAISRKLLKFANAELEKNVASDILVAAALLLVALNSKVSKFDQSTLVLEKLVAIELAASDAPLHGSIFKAIIEVYELSNSAKKLSELYTAIVTKFKSLSVESIRGNDNLYKLILAVAVKLLTVDLEAESAELLNLLLTVKESEVVASILNSNADGLLSVQELESEADVETLLAVNVEELAPKLPVPKAKKIKQADFKVKKKTTKPKFSKNKFFKPASEFDPEKDLDREKWLPMKLRSYYKPSKKELKKKSGGHQGAIESSPAPQVAQQVSSSSKSKKTKKKKGKK
ncbi:CIC11C00000000233 [Sungouiella intermedia]|uniref:Signal recognition particle subunit SRP72 n=1 Tax=Sungouiella intermedia TaxID=45354 RepID=A0A1L0DG69_9ASCO|nr:CIC11C00000000233 [[Candida] intermedia]